MALAGTYSVCGAIVLHIAMLHFFQNSKCPLKGRLTLTHNLNTTTYGRPFSNSFCPPICSQNVHTGADLRHHAYHLAIVGTMLVLDICVPGLPTELDLGVSATQPPSWKRLKFGGRACHDVYVAIR